MECSNDIIQELLFVDKWLTDNDKNGKWYLEYLEKIFEQLKNINNDNNL